MDYVLMKGNEAIAEAAIRSGCRHYFGYPITPQTEISEYMAKMMPKVGGLSLQAESEIAAINMVLGASASGARTMTSSSSPGISLKSEGISYIAGSDLPCVIINVQRGGPGLGGIQPAQSDYTQATHAQGHGDMRMIVLAPSSVQEMVSLTTSAFDMADIYRMPVMLLADGALGQMMEPVSFDEVTKRDTPEKTWAANGHKGGRKNNIVNSLYIAPEALEKVVNERYKKYEQIAKNEVQYEEYDCEDSDLVVVSFGITARIVKSAVKMANDAGLKVGYFRPISLWPFPNERLLEISKKTKKFLVTELNMGQMIDDVKIATQFNRPIEFYGRTGGMMPSPKDVFEQIMKIGGTK